MLLLLLLLYSNDVPYKLNEAVCHQFEGIKLIFSLSSFRLSFFSLSRYIKSKPRTTNLTSEQLLTCRWKQTAFDSFGSHQFGVEGWTAIAGCCLLLLSFGKAKSWTSLVFNKFSLEAFPSVVAVLRNLIIIFFSSILGFSSFSFIVQQEKLPSAFGLRMCRKLLSQVFFFFLVHCCCCCCASLQVKPRNKSIFLNLNCRKHNLILKATGKRGRGSGEGNPSA